MSIRTKILIPMVLMAMICSMTICVIAVLVVKAFTNDFNKRLLLHAETLASTSLAEESDKAESFSAMSATNENLINVLLEYAIIGNRQPLVDASILLLKETGVDFLTVLDTNGNVLVRAHEPDNYGDSLASQTNIKTAMTGSQYTTIEKGSAVKLSVRSGTPIYDRNGNMIAIVSLGYRLDQDGFVDYIKQITETEVTVFLEDTRISTTLLNEKGNRAIDTKTSETISKKVLEGKQHIGRTNEAGRELYTCYSPLLDAKGSVLGMLVVGLDTTDTDERIVRDIWITVAFMVFLGIVAGIVSLNVSSRIVEPISQMSIAANKLAEGDVDVEISVTSQKETKDETVHLAMAFSDMIHSNRERAQLITEVAGGDLSGTIVPKSEKDVVGIALMQLLDKNNLAFDEMSLTATQLNSASSQMAQGAQDLSHDAAMQASTVEQLNFKLKSLYSKTIEEAKNANHAANLSESVKEFAEKGSHQMDQMMDAVEQISSSSESIGKVIKVIDDIAFQTNILALNAAIEAARAGQHGKGFAVVAEEVRSLAAKSADAAKDTGSLIENSIEKAKLGAQISSSTAASFADIVGGINESTGIVEEIAGFMQSQKVEIEGIVNGVEEIGTIVTSVNASAEQSAAAAETMSSQATLMAETLSAYKLRGNN